MDAIRDQVEVFKRTGFRTREFTLEIGRAIERKDKKRVKPAMEVNSKIL